MSDSTTKSLITSHTLSSLGTDRFNSFLFWISVEVRAKWFFSLQLVGNFSPLCWPHYSLVLLLLNDTSNKIGGQFVDGICQLTWFHTWLHIINNFTNDFLDIWGRLCTILLGLFDDIVDDLLNNFRLNFIISLLCLFLLDGCSSILKSLVNRFLVVNISLQGLLKAFNKLFLFLFSILDFFLLAIFFLSGHFFDHVL